MRPFPIRSTLHSFMAELSKIYAVKKPYLPASSTAATSQMGDCKSRLRDIRGNAAMIAVQGASILRNSAGPPDLRPAGHRHKSRVTPACRPIQKLGLRLRPSQSPGPESPRRQYAERDERQQHDPLGSDPVGARSCRNGTFKNPCATRTNTLR